MGSQVDIRVAQQRENGVIKRRGREFNLPTLPCLAVFRNDASQQLELYGAKRRLVLFGKAATLRNERPDSVVAIEVVRIDPGELVPHLQVAQVFGREVCRLRADAQ